MFTKKTLSGMIIALMLVAVTCLTGGILSWKGVNKANASPIPVPETDTFVMQTGADYKLSDPSGIRFTTYVDNDYYAGLVSSGKTFRFGTIFAPATAYSGTIADFNHGSDVTDGVNDLKVGANNWYDDEADGYKLYRTVQLFSENARDNGYYGVKMLAKSYVWIDEDGDGIEDTEEFTYAAGVVRSLGQVASSAIADGLDDEYVTAITQNALTVSTSISGVSGSEYHKNEQHRLEERDCEDYVYVPNGSGCEISYTPALLHTGAYMSDLSDYNLTYGSSDEDVFTVNDSGNLTAVGVGSAALTYNAGSKVVPKCNVNVIDAVSTAGDSRIKEITYFLDDVSHYGDSHLLVFDADYINAKITEGYDNVQFKIYCPNDGGKGEGQNGGKSVRLYVNSAKTTIASGLSDEYFETTVQTLSADTTYTLLCRQSDYATLDFTIVARFSVSDLDTVWQAGTNTEVSMGLDGNDTVTRVTTTAGYNSKAGYVTIPAERLTGKALVSFDFKILSMKDNGGADITEPKLIWYQAAGEAGTSNYGNYWSVPGGRLTPKDGGVNEGYQRIVKVSDSTEMAWNDTFAWDTWYRVTLTLKYDDVQLSQVMNAGAGQYDILYKDFVFEDEYDLSWNVGSNNTIIAAPYENENITRIMNSGSQGYIYIPSEDLAGIGTVSFDFNIKSISVTKPKIIYLQDVPGANPYGAYWDASVRLTPRGDNPSYTNIGYQTITKISDSTSMNWDDDFETDTWYRVTLKLKSAVQLIQVVNNASACSYDMLYKNFVFERDTIWNTAINAEISNYEYNDEIVTRVTTTSRAAAKGSAVTIPASKLSGIATVSFDVMVTGFNGTTEGTVQPKFIYYHYNPSSESDYGSYWNNDIRLTDRGANVGYVTIIKVSDSSSVAWDGDFEIGCWYRVTLTLKSTSVPVAQVANNGGACTYDALYKNFVFTPAA